MDASETAIRSLIERYFTAFNAGDAAGMTACVAEDVVHEVSQGPVRSGRDAFASFLDHMNERYAERVHDMVVMISPDGRRAAAEYMLDGTYLATDEGLPKADGQTYRLRVGSFFAIGTDATGAPLIERVSTHYNLADWTRQVGGREG